jgi:hypothetical protein
MPIKDDWEAGEILTAAQVSTYLANAGLDFIKEVYVGDNTVSSVEVTDAFTNTDYVNFKIVYQNIDPSGTATYWLFQFLDGTGTPVTTDYYCSTMKMTLGGTTITGEAFSNGWYVFDGSTSGYRFGSFDVYDPNSGGYPLMVGDSIDRINYRRLSGSYNLLDSFTDFRLVGNTAGSIVGGSIIVYGYRRT